MKKSGFVKATLKPQEGIAAVIVVLFHENRDTV